VKLSPDPYAGPEGIENDDYIYANDTCAGDQEDVTGDGYSWASSDTAVATLPNRTLHTVAVGGATGSTLVQLQRANPPHCPVTTFGPQQSVTVQKPTITSITPPRGLIGNSVSVTINGTGFGGSGLSVSAGSGISVEINSSTATQIKATFAVASSASGGNSSVTVTAGGGTSAPANFYVQIPKTLIRDAGYGTGGLGALVSITNGNVVDIYGTILASGVWRVSEHRIPPRGPRDPRPDHSG
jgi:hypothetical protein